MTYLTISHIDKKTEEILSYIAKKAGGRVLREKKKKSAPKADHQDFIDEMDRIIKDIEKDFYAAKKNSNHKELRKRA